jgi:hypothetical protein
VSDDAGGGAGPNHDKIELMSHIFWRSRKCCLHFILTVCGEVAKRLKAAVRRTSGSGPVVQLVAGVLQEDGMMMRPCIRLTVRLGSPARWRLPLFFSWHAAEAARRRRRYKAPRKAGRWA